MSISVSQKLLKSPDSVQVLTLPFRTHTQIGQLGTPASDENRALRSLLPPIIDSRNDCSCLIGERAFNPVRIHGRGQVIVRGSVLNIGVGIRQASYKRGVYFHVPAAVRRTAVDIVTGNGRRAGSPQQGHGMWWHARSR